MQIGEGAGSGVGAGPERDGKPQRVPEHTEAKVEVRRPGRGSFRTQLTVEAVRWKKGKVL